MGRLLLVIAAISFLAGCFHLPVQSTPVSDPSLQPLWVAAGKIGRTALGFQPLPTTGNVGVERTHGLYDVMLHFPQHEVAFRKTADGYEWIWEQETYIGPQTYETPDGPQAESIVITYQTVQISGGALNEPVILYEGPDSRLLKARDAGHLKLTDVLPALQQWQKP